MQTGVLICQKRIMFGSFTCDVSRLENSLNIICPINITIQQTLDLVIITFDSEKIVSFSIICNDIPHSLMNVI